MGKFRGWVTGQTSGTRSDGTKDTTVTLTDGERNEVRTFETSPDGSRTVLTSQEFVEGDGSSSNG